MTGLADSVLAGWPLAMTLAMALAAQRLRAGRQRSALNRAMHELRRPLQVLALAAPRAAPAGPAPLDLAIAALDDLDRQINGGGGAEPGWRPVSARELAGAAVGRWRSRATIAGGSIQLRWEAGSSVVLADPTRLSQALDNLILNALEHGGPEIRVEGRASAARLRLAIADDGVAARPASRRGSPGEVIARLTGRRRRGHGLQVVRETVQAHGGRFMLRRSERGSSAVLELPLAGKAGSLVA
jgi:signal transduction histidine kinase